MRTHRPGMALAAALTFVSPHVIAQDSAFPCPWPGPSQLLGERPSPPDSALAAIGDMTVKLCYSRPSARGRRIFDSLVPYGRPWRTGANEPTLLYLPFAADVAGIALGPGTYVLLTIPDRDRWTVILHTSDAPTPQEMFDALVEVGRGTVTAEALEDPVEALTIRGTGGVTGGELVLEWVGVRVRIPITRHPAP